jgi:thioesterase domain-containing protein
MDKQKYKAPYIVMGHSHGIYYACEFAKQHEKEVKCIVSLDGSWITNELNKQRLMRWKDKGKIIPKINNQKTLDDIVDKIKNEKDT